LGIIADRQSIKNAIIRNPIGHEKLTGRYYLTSQGIEFFCGSRPKPEGAVRIPSFADNHPFQTRKPVNEEVINKLTQWFVDRLPPTSTY